MLIMALMMVIIIVGVINVIVNKLSETMGRKRMKIKDVVERSGLSMNTVTDMYYDRSKMVLLDTFDRLCTALECENLSEVLEYIPNKRLDEEFRNKPMG